VDGDDAEGLLAEADRRMYLGKQQYRRCAQVQVADKSLAALAASLDGAPAPAPEPI